MEIIKNIEMTQLREDIPVFKPGDTVKVHVKVVEGTRERIQVFEGVVIARKGGGLRETFTVRRVSYGVGVERVFPVHSPRIDRIEVARRGRVRRAKLYYLRNLTGKAAERLLDRGSLDARRRQIVEQPRQRHRQGHAQHGGMGRHRASLAGAAGAFAVEVSITPIEAVSEAVCLPPRPEPVRLFCESAITSRSITLPCGPVGCAAVGSTPS